MASPLQNLEAGPAGKRIGHFIALQPIICNRLQLFF